VIVEPVKITDRQELGALWLAWCIDRESGAPINIGRERAARMQSNGASL
jgi:hypothetical protein